MDSDRHGTKDFAPRLKKCIVFICLFPIFTPKSGISDELAEYLFVDTMWVHTVNSPPFPTVDYWWKMNNGQVTGPAFLTEITAKYIGKGKISEFYLNSIGISDVIRLMPSSNNYYSIEFSNDMEYGKYFYYSKLLMNTGDFSNVHFILPATLDTAIDPFRWNHESLHQKLVFIVKDRMYVYENSEWYRTEKWHKSRKINLNEMIVHFPAGKRRGLTLSMIQSIGVTNVPNLERMPLDSWYRLTFPEGMNFTEYFPIFQILYGSGKFDRLLFDGSLPLDNSGAIPDSILTGSGVIPAAAAPPLTYNLHPVYPNPFPPERISASGMPRDLVQAFILFGWMRPSSERR